VDGMTPPGYYGFAELEAAARQRRRAMAKSPTRMADADFVLRWVCQAGSPKIPQNIVAMAARALGREKI
jgi:hypothetical protein